MEGKTSKAWKDVPEYELRVIGLEKGMLVDRETWRRQSYEPVNPS